MKYSIIGFAVKYSKFFNFLAIAVIIFGAFVFLEVKKDFAPPIKEGFISIKVVYPGASPAKVQEEIILPIEKKINAISSIKKSSAIAKKNVGFILLSVKREYYDTLNDVFQKVQSAVNDIDFPNGVRKPEFRSFTPDDNPTISIHISGENPIKAREAVKEFETAVQQISDSGELSILGKRNFQYLVAVDPEKLAQRNIPLGEVYQAIQNAVADIPGGEILKNENLQNLNIVSRLDSIEDIGNIVIRVNEQFQAIYVKDLADVQYVLEEEEAAYIVNGVKGIVLQISKTEQADIIKFNKKIEALTQEFQRKYPQISFTAFDDKSIPVQSRLELLNSNLTYGLVLVFVILLLFFNFSTAFWTVMGVPVAFSIGLILASIYYNISINIMSMIGFIVVLGIVVDDAIVFSENSYRYLEQGFPPKDAVVKGMGEVLPSVFFAILTTVSAVLCMLLIGGRIGDYSRPLPIIMALTLFASFFEGILVLPGHLVHSFHGMQHPIKPYSKPWRQRFFMLFQTPFEKALMSILRNRKKALVIFIGFTVMLVSILLSRIPFVFFAGPPSEIVVFFETNAGTPLEKTEQITAEIENYMSQNPLFDSVYAVAGDENDAYKAKLTGYIKKGLNPRYDWNIYKQEMLDFVENYPMIRNFRFNVVREDSLTYDIIDIQVKGTDYSAVKNLAEEIRNYTATLSNIQNPRLDIAEPVVEQKIVINPVQARAYGLTPREIAQYISLAFEGQAPTFLHKDGDEVDIFVRYDEPWRTPDSLLKLQIPNKFARFVALNQVANFNEEKENAEIRSENGLYTVKVLDTMQNVNVLSNNAFSILSKIEKQFANKTNQLTAAPYFENEKEETAKSMKEIGIAVALGLVLIFGLLIFLFNSYIHAIIVLSVTPFISVGLVIGLTVMKLPLSNMAIIGAVSLLGVVVNDSIVMLEFLRSYVKENDDFIASVAKGAAIRLRSIMMTTTTTVVGVMPVALGFAGHEFYLQPLAVAIMFGVLFLSIITLFLVPVLITILEEDCGHIFKKSQHMRNLLFNTSVWRKFKAKIQKILSPIFSFMLLFLVEMPVFGQESQEILPTQSVISEMDFLNLYLDNALDVKMIYTDVQAAHEKAKIAFSPFGGSFFIKGSYTDGITSNSMPLHKISISGRPLSTNMQVKYTNASAGLGFDAVVWPIGTYMKIEGGVQYTENDSSKTDLSTMSQTSDSDKYFTPYFDLSIIQPLLKNGFAYNMHKKVVKIADREKDATKLEKQVYLENTILQALTKFHRLVLDGRILAIRQESLQQMSRMLNTQQQLQRAGARSLWDIQQFQVQVEKIGLDIQTSTKNLERDFLELEDRLNIKLSRTNLGFLDYTLLSEKQYEWDLVYRQTLEKNANLARIRILLSNVNDAVAIAKNQLLPELNFTVSYRKAENKNQVNTSYNIPLDNFYTGLEFRIPLNQKPEKARVKEAILNAQSLDINRQEVEQNLLFISREKFFEWENFKEQLAYKTRIADLNRSIAIEARARYRNAEISITDLFTYEENYRISRIDLEIENFKYKLALLSLEFIQGTLLDLYNIEFS